MTNIFENLPVRTEGEEFTDLFSRRGVRIERIVSNGQSTPTDTPYERGHDEWFCCSVGQQVYGLTGMVSVICVLATTYWSLPTASIGSRGQRKTSRLFGSIHFC